MEHDIFVKCLECQEETLSKQPFRVAQGLAILVMMSGGLGLSLAIFFQVPGGLLGLPLTVVGFPLIRDTRACTACGFRAGSSSSPRHSSL